MNRITTIATVMFVAGFSMHAAAETKTDFDKDALLKCQLETKSDVRLACYDAVLPPSAAVNDETTAGTGKWQVSSKTSPVDDTKNVYLILAANESIRSQFGESITPNLFITCREKKTELYLNWDVFIGTDEASMLYRLDKQKAKTQTWDISSDNKAVFYRGNVVEFVKTLAKANGMYTQITPYGESPVSVSFDLSGLSEALKPLQKACSWK
ncbi:type VI secretion protein [Kosakonia sp. MH5]|nr:type VI secretion protein [Kosakonia sp. MH5]